MRLPRKDRRAFDRHTLGEDDRVARTRPGGQHHVLLAHFAEQRADRQRTRKAMGDLRVPPDQRDTQRSARLLQLLEDGAHRVRTRALGQQHCRQQPPGSGSHDGEVVRVHLHQVPADQLRRKGDGVQLGHQVAVAHVYQGGVLARPGAKHDAGVVGLDLPQKLGKELRRQLPGPHPGLAHRTMLS